MTLKTVPWDQINSHRDLAAAVDIEGFMRFAELDWLATVASASEFIAEIGCWRGRSTRAMADNTTGTIFAIDHFEGSPELEYILDTLPPGWLFKTFMKNVFDCPNVIPLRMKSLAAAHVLAPMRFDLIFIDGAHDYKSVCEDINAWRPLLRDGGMLCGHDAGYHDVKKAVMELLPDAKVVKGTAIWWWQR